jgi:hypothetical protein
MFAMVLLDSSVELEDDPVAILFGKQTRFLAASTSLWMSLRVVWMLCCVFAYNFCLGAL